MMTFKREEKCSYTNAYCSVSFDVTGVCHLLSLTAGNHWLGKTITKGVRQRQRGFESVKERVLSWNMDRKGR